MLAARWRRSVTTAAVAFVVSRAVIVLLALAAGALQREPRSGLPDVPRIVLAEDLALNQLRAMALRHDASWYFDVATRGYERRPFDVTRQANWAFFPLHPWLWQVALGATGNDPLSGLWMANVVFLVALAVVHRVTLTTGRDAAVADRAVLVLAFFPVSYFFSLPWSESLFLLLTATAFLAALERRWLLLGVAGALASATRLGGIFLVPALLPDLWPRRSTLPARAWIALASVPLGLLVFGAVLWNATGNPLAFAGIQAAWGRAPGLPLAEIAQVASRGQELAIDWNVGALNVLTLLLTVGAVVHLACRREHGLAILLALGIAAPVATGTLMSVPRYAMALFPLAIAVADWTDEPLRAGLWFGASAALLAVMSVAFAGALTFAGA